jgi:hypothetical protein
MDVLMTDKWLPQLLMSEEKRFEDRAMSLYFENNGYQSMNVMKNLGSTGIYLILNFSIIIILYVILTPLSRYRRYFADLKQFSFKRITDWVRTKMVWNGLLRFILQYYPPILISGIISLYNVSCNISP